MSTIAGYTYNAEAYHPDCLPEGINPDGEEVGVVFTWEDAACELTCDVCFDPLLECDCNEA